MSHRFVIFGLLLILASMVYASGQINIAYSPYTISRPGSYIVVKDLTTAQNQNCITITTTNVNIDLNGHTLYGAGTTIGTLGSGILGTTRNFINNITLANGIIRDFRQNGINISGNNVSISNFQILSNKSSGIIISQSGIIQNCIVYGNGYNGIESGNGTIVTGNNVQSNGGNGIFGNYACIIKGNICRTNKLDGIRVYTENQVVGNECNANQGNGIHAVQNENSIIGNYITLNGLGLLSDVSGNYFEQNKLSNNTGSENLNGSTEGSFPLSNVIF